MKIIRKIIREEIDKNLKIEVFLGGTANNSQWRDDLIEKLKIHYFNPIVNDWNEEVQKNEIKKRKTCDYILYVITPKMSGVYSIAEVVDDSNKRPEKTLFCILEKDEDNKFDKHQIKSLNMVKSMVKENGVKIFENLNQIANYLNKQKK